MRLPTPLLSALFCFVALPAFAAEDPFAWPATTPEAKPWTRWWWPGSAATKADLTADLEAIAAVGIGGVELTPVYGAKGYEQRYVDYLTPEWLDLFEHAVQEAGRLGLGIDMAGGTGWNFGGPSVGDRDAAKHVAFRRFTVPAGERLQEGVTLRQEPWVRYVLNQAYHVNPNATTALPAADAAGRAAPVNDHRSPDAVETMPLPAATEILDPLSRNKNLQQLAIDQIKFARDLPLQALMAYGPDRQVLDLTARVDANGRLDWTAPAGNGPWQLYAVFQGWNGKLVERGGPGGEGFMIDHFSPDATKRYLAQFDPVLAEREVEGLRAFFNDSYEVDDALFDSNWTDDFLTQFQQRRGYDLRDHLPALFSSEVNDTRRRVLSDYRETLSDLLLERYTRHWADWAHRHGKIIRNQAHGSPANILDLYAASDIPETEGVSPPHIRLASSAAHVAGRPLVGAEAVTFLNENFLSTPAQIRDNLRRYWLHGVNHVTYHGTAFSPQDEAWPGWFFYVAVHLNPRNPIWAHTAAVHDYAARVQSFLQAGQPDNDILLYFPIHDRYAEVDTRRLPRHEGDGPDQSLVQHIKTGGADLTDSPVGQAAAQLLERGYAFDYISDAQLLTARVRDGRVATPGSDYRLILVPRVEYMPLATRQKLQELASAGATVAFIGALPADVPGLGQLAERRKELAQLNAAVQRDAREGAGVRATSVGRGRMLVAENLNTLLERSGVRREMMHERGLQTIRRRVDGGVVYYIVNPSERPVEGWIPLASAGRTAFAFDAWTEQVGTLPLRTPESPEIYLQIKPGGSLLVRLHEAEVNGAAYPLWQTAGDPRELRGTWKVEFLSGGPELPASRSIDRLESWTTYGPDYARFSGTARYTQTFRQPQAANETAGWLLDLGEVEETARVSLNGRDVGVVVGPTRQVIIPTGDLQPENRLEIEVANLAANRIADLDRRDPSWKKFYNMNIRALRPENRDAQGMFRAAHWEPRDSGLLGPVTLQPLRRLEPKAAP